MKKWLLLLMLAAALPAAAAMEPARRKEPPAPKAVVEPEPPPCEAPAERASAFRAGEEIKYKMEWGIFNNAGELRFRTEYVRSGNGAPRFCIFTDTATTGMLRKFHSMDNQIETVLDAREWRVVETTVRVREGRKRGHKTTVIDYQTGTAVCTDYVKPEKNARRELPYACVLDTVSAIFRARTWDIKPGEARSILVHDDGKKYLLNVVAHAVEEIETPYGVFQALRIEPRMDFNPKGFFKRSSEVYVWISQDEWRLPVKISTKLKIGKMEAHLTDYTPPSAEAGAEPQSLKIAAAAPGSR